MEPSPSPTKEPPQGGDIANPLKSFEPGDNFKLDALEKSNFSEDPPESKPEPQPDPELSPKDPEPDQEPKGKDPEPTPDPNLENKPESKEDIFAPIDPEAKPKDEPKEEPKEEPVSDIEKKKESNSNLRNSLEEANTRLKSQTELTERITGENKALQERLQQQEAELKGFRERNNVQNPQDHPEVRKILDPLQNEVEALADRMTLKGDDGTKLKSLIPQLIENYRQLGSSDSEGYRERADQLNTVVQENFKEGSFDSIVDLMSRGAMAMNQAGAKIQDIQENSQKYQNQQAREQFTSLLKNHEDVERGYFNPTPDLRENDPLNVKVILADMIDSNDQVKDRSDQIKRFIRQTQLPLPPVDDVEIQGMDAEAAAKYLQTRANNHLAQQRQLNAMLGDALLASVVLPMVVKRLSEAKSALRDQKEMEPRPSDNGKHDEGDTGGEDEGESESKNITDFDPGFTNYDFSQ